jgi:folate-binding protein YgfZ
METYWKARQACVWWENNLNDVIWAEGKDAASYLQSQITQDILKLEVGQGIPAALVDRKGHIQSLFSVHRYQETRYLLVPENNSAKLFEHLEAFHFVEEVSLQKTALTRIHLEGPQTADILKTLTGKVLNSIGLESIHSAAVPGGSALLISQSLLAEDGVTFFLEEAQKVSFIQLLQEQLNLPQLSDKAYHCLRIEAGKPLWGQDLNAETQLPSTGQEVDRVSYDKGCYLGQEVIARIRSYGVPPYKLMGFQFDGEPPALGAFDIEGKKRGEWTSICWSPQYEKHLALGYLHKSYRESGKQLELTQEDQSYKVEIKRLPFYTPPDKKTQAQALYDQALNAFAEDQETMAIGLLQSALEKDVQLADAYESLGVILSRQGRHQEAIEIMKQLTEIAPEEPMAHTNLSRFYMLLGDKATAEEHMAEATRLDMLKKMSVQKQEALVAEDRARKIDMIEMFKEVLETEDAEDLVANFGLGKALVDLERYEEAEAYLQKAVKIDPFYSAAYLQLGKALSAQDKQTKARQVYTQGIQAASEKGDLMPMKEMEQRLLALN